MQVLERVEAGAFEQTPRENGEPNLHLIEPRAMSRRIDEADPVLRVAQEFTSAGERFQDPALAFDPELVFDAAALGNQLNQARRAVGIELVGDEYPTRFGRGVYCGFDVRGKIRFVSCRTKGWADELAGGDMEVGNQTQGAVAAVLKLDAFHPTGTHWLGFMHPLERLHAGFLVHAHDVGTLRGQGRRLAVDVA